MDEEVGHRPQTVVQCSDGTCDFDEIDGGGAT
jgi:hypothetical protein